MIANRERVKLLEVFESFFLASFEGVLVPRLIDTEYQGILPQEEIKGPPLPLLTEGGKLIRSLIFQEDQGVLSLLLPSAGVSLRAHVRNQKLTRRFFRHGMEKKDPKKSSHCIGRGNDNKIA